MQTVQRTMKTSQHADKLHHICKYPKDISVYTHVSQNTERCGQSKSILFGVLNFQQLLPNGIQSWRVKYFSFEHLFHNLYFSWTCKYQLQKLKAYVQLDPKYELHMISMETA